MKKINTKTFIGIILGTLLVGIGVGWLLFSTSQPTVTEGSKPSDEVTIWTCAMHPQIRRNEPGQCPICGMELIPVGSNSNELNEDAWVMSATARKLADVQTTRIGSGAVAKEIQLTGTVQADERSTYAQPTHIPGRVEQLRVNFTGEAVRKGQVLATLYAPELVTAQQELLEALKLKDTQPALYTAAREKLKNWKLSNAFIEQLVNTGQVQQNVPVAADVSGIVTERHVNPGDYLKRGETLYTITDLSHVWIQFDVYEDDLPWVHTGDEISFTVPAWPGKTFTGKVTFIDPVIHPQTRVAEARVEIKNTGLQLKPQMLADGVLVSNLPDTGEALVVPRSAVMWTGERSVVYVRNETAAGISFQMQPVILGPATAAGYVVKDGLTAGAEVVTHGTFAVDAAAQLAGKPSMMNQPKNQSSSMVSMNMAMPITPEQQALWKQTLTAYFNIKDALVADDAQRARLHAIELEKVLAKENLSEKHRGRLLAIVKGMVSAKDLTTLRNQFITLSEQVVHMAGMMGAGDTTYYVMHCPMANSNQGADWLSLEKNIRNPYFGSQMLTCGEVVKEIK